MLAGEVFGNAKLSDSRKAVSKAASKAPPYDLKTRLNEAPAPNSPVITYCTTLADKRLYQDGSTKPAQSIWTSSQARKQPLCLFQSSSLHTFCIQTELPRNLVMHLSDLTSPKRESI